MVRLARLAWVLPLCLLAGCSDLRAFAGSWEGRILAEEAIRAGFGTEARVAPLRLEQVDSWSASGVLTTSDGRFVEARLTPLEKAAGDRLGSLTFDGDPLRTYLLVAPLAAAPNDAPALVLLSLFADDTLELRIIWGNSLYGVFEARRSR